VDVLTPLSDYLKSIGPNDLPKSYKEFAKSNFFGKDSAILKGDKIPLGEVSQWALRKSTETSPASYALKIPADYASSLLGLRVEGKNRALTVGVAEVPSDAEVYVYKLVGNLKKGATPVADFAPGAKDQSTDVSVSQDDALYVLAVNTGHSDLSASVTISEKADEPKATQSCNVIFANDGAECKDSNGDHKIFDKGCSQNGSQRVHFACQNNSCVDTSDTDDCMKSGDSWYNTVDLQYCKFHYHYTGCATYPLDLIQKSTNMQPCDPTHDYSCVLDPAPSPK
jgi:hypothetical protein